jgi:hypothetical protein
MSKPKIVLMIGRAQSSVTGEILCKYAKFLTKHKSTHDFVLVCPAVKTHKSAEIIIDRLGIKPSHILLGRCLYSETHNPYSSWMDMHEKTDWFKDIDNIESIYLFGGLLMGALNRKKRPDLMTKFINSNASMRFVSICNYLVPTLQLIRLANKQNIPLHEFCYDPDEHSINLLDICPSKYTLSFGYDIPKYGMIQNRQWQYGLSLIPKQKVYDLVFGATFVTDARYIIYDKLKPLLDNLKPQLFIRHKLQDINSSIGYADYLDYIARSRFTLLIPAYDIATFSIFRMTESIMVDCLPLITEDVNTNDFIQSFALDKSIVDEITIPYSATKIDITDSRRLEILQYLKHKLCLT